MSKRRGNRGMPPTTELERLGDIGAAQPAVVQLANAGVFVGVVLDAGCGTGDNALCIAARGGHVLGFDVAPTAVSIAREHAAAEGLDADSLSPTRSISAG